MNITGRTWFSTMDGSLIGIVVVQPEFGPQKAYIGTAEGHNEELDAACIAHTGAKFPSSAAKIFFPDIGHIGD